MKKLLSTVATLIAVIISATFIVPLAACGNEGSKTVKIANMGGYGLAGVDVKIYDGTNEIYNGKSNSNGEIRLDLGNGKYKVELDNLPKGYYSTNNMTLDGNDKTPMVRVPSRVIEENAPDGHNYTIGSIMYDFTLSTVYSYNSTTNSIDTNSNIKLSDVLKEKNTAILNFWYKDCTWCAREFPHMNEAYQEYKDKLSILAINNYPTDYDSTVKDYIASTKYDFDFAKDSAGVVSRFDISGYPTTIIIDRYGIVCEQMTTITDIEIWKNAFAKYTADDYNPIYGDGETEDDFVPEKPATHGVTMSSSKDINTAINNTGTDIIFSTDVSVTAWPWRVADDGKSIYATNKGYRGTIGIIFARLNLEKDKVLAFEYKFEGVTDTDYFRVSVDGRYGFGLESVFTRQRTSDWTKGVAYIPLEAGSYEISFSYGRYYTGTNDDSVSDTAYVRNIHLEDIDQIGDMDLNIPYYTARQQNAETGKFESYSEVYKDGDGYYRIGTEETANSNDPYLYVALSDPAPYFSLNTVTIYNKYIGANNCVFNGVDYFDTFNEYIMYLRNSSVLLNATSGPVVPVRENLRQALEALYNSENNITSPQYSENGWLEFCSFIKHYGNNSTSAVNPVAGLSYFSAFEAKETTGLPDTSSELNVAEFDRLLNPKGILYKFVPNRSGAYKFESLGKETWADAELYDDTLNTAPALHPSINSCGYDYFPRYIENLEDETGASTVNFKMYHYLEAGKTYYLSVANHVIEDLMSFKFRIDWVGETFDYLTTATAGFYTSSGNKIILPVYVNAKYDAEKDVYYDANTNQPIYVDFTACSRLFTNYPIEKLIDRTMNGVKAFDFTGEEITVDGVKYVGKDYTEIMRDYVAKSKEGKSPNDELYGMLEPTKELKVIICLFYQRHVGFDDDNEWLKACWYNVHLAPAA